MSKHAKPTLVRFFREGQDGRQTLVKDIETGDNGYIRFTLPVDSPLTDWLFNDGVCGVRVVIMDTEEVEFRIDKIERAVHLLGDYGAATVTCQSLAARLRRTLPDDDYAIELFGVEQ